MSRGGRSRGRESGWRSFSNRPGFTWISYDARHWTTSDPQGRYHIGSIPRRDADGKPMDLQVVVAKDGFARTNSEPFVFEPGENRRPHVADPIRLERGVTLSGTVVDPRGRPVEGAVVEPNFRAFASELQFTRTDKKGHFTLRLSKGMVPIDFSYGELVAGKKYLADGAPEEILVPLHPRPKPGEPRPAAAAPPARPKPLAVGQPAPEWQVGAWSARGSG